MFDYNDYREMLDYIDPASASYEEWAKIGMALKAELDDPGLDLWDQWSAKDPARYHQNECSKKWDSFKKSGITGKTIYRMAEKNGYRKFRIDTSNIERIEWDKLTWEETNALIEKDINDKLDKKRGVKRGVKKEPAHRPDQTMNYTDNNTTDPGEKSELIKALLDTEGGIFNQFITQSQANLFNDKEAGEYVLQRGLDVDTLAHFKIGYQRDYIVERKDKDGNIKKYTIPRAIIIPGSNYGYGIRNFTEGIQKKDRYRKPDNGIYPESIDIPIGLQQVIQEPNKRNPDNGYLEPIFICEGYFDAPSFYEIGADAIALNTTGTGNIKRIVEAFKYFRIKRPVILALDNDGAGHNGQESAFLELKNEGIDVYKVNPSTLYQDHKDANECLINERLAFKDRVNKAKRIPVNDFEQKLNKNQLESFLKYVDNSLEYPPIPTGFDLLDDEKILDGGLYPGSLYTMGALSSTGKTTLMLQIADNIATQGYPVLYISLEMGAHELRAKSISRYTYDSTIERQISDTHARTIRGITDKRRYQNYVDLDLEIIEEAGERYFNDTGDNLLILERHDNHVTVASIEKQVEQFEKVIGRAPVLFIDYLQIMDRSETQENKSVSDKQVIDENIKALKRLAVDKNIPVFNISSLNRDSYNAPMTMASFKESGAIEYSSDVLIALEPAYIILDPMFDQRSPKEQANEIKRAKEYERENYRKTGERNLDVKVMKNRNGKAGQNVHFHYNAKFNHYKELTAKEWLDLQKKTIEKIQSLEQAGKASARVIAQHKARKKNKSAIPKDLKD